MYTLSLTIVLNKASAFYTLKVLYFTIGKIVSDFENLAVTPICLHLSLLLKLTTEKLPKNMKRKMYSFFMKFPAPIQNDTSEIVLFLNIVLTSNCT